MNVIVPLRPVDPEQDYVYCSGHSCCEGPRLCQDHDKICDAGNDCDSDSHWRGCKWCKELCVVCNKFVSECRCPAA